MADPNLKAVQFAPVSTFKGKFTGLPVVPGMWTGTLKLVSPDTEPLAAALSKGSGSNTAPPLAAQQSPGMLSNAANAAPAVAGGQ